MSQTRPAWIRELSTTEVALRLSSVLYPAEVVFRVAYIFTDHCYVYLAAVDGSDDVDVRLSSKSDGTDLTAIASEFANALVDQRLRRDIALETRGLRELIAAQAFAEADFLDRSGVNADYNDDPLGIGERE